MVTGDNYIIDRDAVKQVLPSFLWFDMRFNCPEGTVWVLIKFGKQGVSKLVDLETLAIFETTILEMVRQLENSIQGDYWVMWQHLRGRLTKTTVRRMPMNPYYQDGDIYIWTIANVRTMGRNGDPDESVEVIKHPTTIRSTVIRRSPVIYSQRFMYLEPKDELILLSQEGELRCE